MKEVTIKYVYPKRGEKIKPNKKIMAKVHIRNELDLHGVLRGIFKKVGLKRPTIEFVKG
ncbi:hypothetical protein ES707_14886 [subsurface metagenome]